MEILYFNLLEAKYDIKHLNFKRLKVNRCRGPSCLIVKRRRKYKMENIKRSDRLPVPVIISVDSFANGVSIGKVTLPEDQSDVFLPLSLEMDEQNSMLRSRYGIERESSVAALEGRLALLERKGELSRTTIYFGVSADPFHPFESRFDASMKFLSLLERYCPGQIVLQTRSPLLVVAMPLLRKLASKLIVTIPVETSSPESVAKYTPHLPKLSERLRVASVLRRFGIKVHMQVAPLLPYGDLKKDAADFASMLIGHADYISVRALVSGNEKSRKTVPAIATKLAAERNFVWLRPDAAKHLEQCISVLAPKKLEMPVFAQPVAKQLSIFAA
jgi:hypothetical protein